jgi:hypothetical protein
MKTTATIIRYSMTLAFIAIASYVTWTAAMETMAGYFDPWMIVTCLVVFATAPLAHFGLKHFEASL